MDKDADRGKKRNYVKESDALKKRLDVKRERVRMECTDFKY